MSRIESEWQQFATDCDALIKVGQLDSVMTKVKGITITNVPRGERHHIAKICRRVGLITEGLRLLYPVVREESITQKPEPIEICEYAVLLSRNGSTEESLNLLKEVDSTNYPEALLYRAICEIALWNYEVAAGLLENFLLGTPDDYTRLIANINLGAAYLAIGQLEMAASLLKETVTLAKRSGSARLAGNGLEQLGQYFIRKGELARAREVLQEAAAIFGESKGYDRLLISKWQAILNAEESRDVEPLLRVREAAIAQGHWETVREADLFRLKVRFEQSLFDHLYHGSPMPGYKRWLRQQLVHEPSPFLLMGRDRAGVVIDLIAGEVKSDEKVTKIPKKILEVFELLLKDLYLPRNNGALFYGLYPNEYFNSQSSPLKIRQSLHRFRKWLEDQDLPVELENEAAGYRLVIRGSIAIVIGPVQSGFHRSPARWGDLKAVFSDAISFTASDVEDKLKLSRASALRLIKWGLESGEVVKFGLGQASSYEFTRASDRKS